MSKHQAIQIDIPSAFANTLETLGQVPEYCRVVLFNRWTAVKHRRITSNLDPLIQYDIGEIDCRPPLCRSTFAARKSYQSSLEAMLNRSF